MRIWWFASLCIMTSQEKNTSLKFVCNNGEFCLCLELGMGIWELQVFQSNCFKDNLGRGQKNA